MVKNSDLRLIDKMIDKKINQLKIQLLEEKEAKEAKGAKEEKNVMYRDIKHLYSRGSMGNSLHITISKGIVKLYNLQKSQDLFFVKGNNEIYIYFNTKLNSISRKLSDKQSGSFSINIPKEFINILDVKRKDKIILSYCEDKIILKKLK
ncbi:MAG: AbrB/MazE/SpoVT family DNA-binding domain-containing protein [Nitrososphaeraceae archaeon]|nr:AbrB/MazE/SpoVT family DNA-binding domain-containing protein [Nitrososphaeraceae archaeon]